MATTKIFQDFQLPQCIDELITCLNNGGTMIYPTETLYGLGCCATNIAAIKQVNDIKKRPTDKPAVILCAEKDISKYMKDPGKNRIFIDKYWPGPLSLVVEQTGEIPNMLANKARAIALRVSPHPFIKKFMDYARMPLVSTSANISDRSPISDVTTLVEIFNSQVDYIFYSNNKRRDESPSTILDLTNFPPRVTILREGEINKQELMDQFNNVCWN